VIKQKTDYFFYISIFMLVLCRVLTAKIKPCLPEFDCNAYLQMAQSLRYDPALLGHHAMRILPAFLAGVLHLLGFSLETAFRILSDATYLLFGWLVFWVLRREGIKPTFAFSVSLLCLASHHAMRIPLQLVYQTCDMMTYPLSLLMIYFSLKKEAKAVFIFALLGIMTKQTLFVLGLLSLFYCRSVMYSLMLIGAYGGLQGYYHASGHVFQHIHPHASFYSFSHIKWIIQDSKIVDLLVPLLPFLCVFLRSLRDFLWRYWHISLYIGVVVAQPLIAYHLTGNNFQRLALQGTWILFLIVGLLSKKISFSWWVRSAFVVYALCVYFTWGMTQRWIFAIAMSLVILCERGMRQTKYDFAKEIKNDY